MDCKCMCVRFIVCRDEWRLVHRSDVTDSRQLSIVKQRQLNKLKEQEEEQEEAGEVMDRDTVSPTE